MKMQSEPTRSADLRWVEVDKDARLIGSFITAGLRGCATSV